MSTVIYSPTRHITTFSIVRRELDRIQKITGFRPDDWMSEMYGFALQDNINGHLFDFEGFEMQMSCNADHYIDFIRENYPSYIRC